jgi:hypothetical protein
LQAAYGPVPATHTETTKTPAATHLLFRDDPRAPLSEYRVRLSPDVIVSCAETRSGAELAVLPAWIVERFGVEAKELNFSTFLVSLNGAEPNVVVAKKIAQWCHANKFGLPFNYVPDECRLWDLTEDDHGFSDRNPAQNHPCSWPDQFDSQIAAAYMAIVDETAKERAAKILPFVGRRPGSTPIKPQAYYDADGLIIKRPGKVSLVYGRYSHHKTNFAIKKCLDATLDHGARVLFVAGEDADGVENRLGVNCETRGITLEDISDKWLIVGQAPQFRAAHEVDSVLFAWEWFKPDLIVIDTLARSAEGENLNDVGVATAIMGAALTIANRLGSHVILTSHLPKSKGADEAAGSRFFMNNADAAFVLTLRKSTLDVFVRKMKNGPDNRHVFYSIATDRAGVPYVIDVAPSERQAVEAQAEASGFERTVIVALQDIGEPNVTTTELAERLAVNEGGHWESWKRRINRGVKDGSLARLIQARGTQGGEATKFYVPPSVREEE